MSEVGTDKYPGGAFVFSPSGHFFGLIVGFFAAVWSAIGAVVLAVWAVIQAIVMAIVTVIQYAAMLVQNAMAYLGKVLSASWQWASKFAGKVLTGIKAGFNAVNGAVRAGFKWAVQAWSKLGTIAQGAITNSAWNSIQVARAGGKFGDILKAAGRGAVIGAIGAVVGAGMHAFGGAVGSYASGGTSFVGTVLHAAAHGVSGGAMAAANGGSFKDGFIGGAVGFATGLVSGGPMNAIEGGSAGAVLAALAGGLSSKLSGGSFADGAYSAAFFHLFNEELANLSFSDGVRRGFSRTFRGQRLDDDDDLYGPLDYQSGGVIGGLGGSVSLAAKEAAINVGLAKV